MLHTQREDSLQSSAHTTYQLWEVIDDAFRRKQRSIRTDVFLSVYEQLSLEHELLEGFPPNSPIICPIWLQSGELRDRGGLVTYSSAFLRVEALSLVLSLAKQ